MYDRNSHYYSMYIVHLADISANTVGMKAYLLL